MAGTGNPIKFRQMSSSKLGDAATATATVATRSNSHVGMHSRKDLQSRTSNSVFKNNRAFMTGGFSATNLPFNQMTGAVRPQA